MSDISHQLTSGKCRVFLHNSTMVTGYLVIPIQSQLMVEQAIQMAIQPSPVYHKMQMAFSMYEDGQLKGQKSREMKGVAIQKGMEGKFSAKLTPISRRFRDSRYVEFVMSCA